MIEKKGEEAITKIEEKFQTNRGSVSKRFTSIKNFILSKSYYLAAGFFLLGAVSTAIKFNPKLIKPIFSLFNSLAIIDIVPTELTRSTPSESKERWSPQLELYITLISIVSK